MTSSIRTFFCVAGLALVLVTGGGETAAAARAAGARPGPRCGDVITTSIRLERDISGCAGPGLVIGADDVTVDLGGHTISADPSTQDAGVDDGAGHDGVVVRGGRIRGFDVGVLFASGARRGSATDLAVDGGEFAGVAVFGSRDIDVRADRLRGMANAVFLLDASDVRIADNAISDTGFAGIEVDGDSHDNRIVDNRIARTFDVGIALAIHDDDPDSAPTRPTGNVVARNRVADTSFGVLLVRADGNVVEDNDVVRAGRFGDPEAPGGGIGVDGGAGNRIAANRVAGSRGDGIQVTAEAIGTRLGGNLALHNGGYGIEVDGTAIDEGGNVARGNGAPEQCLGISCRS